MTLFTLYRSHFGSSLFVDVVAFLCSISVIFCLDMKIIAMKASGESLSLTHARENSFVYAIKMEIMDLLYPSLEGTSCWIIS